MRIPRRLALAAIHFVLWASGVATVAGFLSARGWILDLAAAFRPAYFVLQAVGTVFFVARKKWLGALAVAAFLATNGQQIAPLYVSDKERPAAGSLPAPTRLKVLQINAGFRNPSTDKIASYVSAVDADIFTIEELTNARARILERLLDSRYPHKFIFPVDSGAGIAVFSKLPLQDPQAVYFADPGLPSIVTGIEIAEREVTLVVTHPLSPSTSHGYRLRNRQLQAIAEARQKYSDRLIVVGDLNVTSWSSSFSDLIAGTGLRDSRKGFGIQPTWPVLGVGRTALVPIDHVLVSEHFTVVSRRVGEDIGSDHFPIVVELELVQ